MPASLIQETRRRILGTTLRACVILGGLAWLPGAWASYRGGLLEVIALSTTVYLALILATFLPGLSFRARSVSLLAIILVLGVGLVLMIGPPGAGSLWLAAAPVMAGILLGTRGALWSLAGVTLVCIALGVLIHLGLAGPLAGADHPGYELDAWIATSGSLVFLAAVLSIAVGVLLDRLEETAHSERESRLELEASAAEQLQLESRLRQSQKMEALGTLAGGIAHDFNNLLVPMIAGTEEARDALPPGSEARIQLDDALRSAARGRDLVRRILTFSRGAGGERMAVRVEELIEESERLLRHTLPASIRVVRAVEDPDATVMADPAELHQVLMNLGTTAYLAMEDIVGTLTLGARREADEVVLTVQDTGVGMDPETLSRALDPFFTTRGPEEGTGLGLSSVHGIVKGLGGRLSLESSPGEGTRVEVRLPAWVPPEGSLRPAAGATSAAGASTPRAPFGASPASPSSRGIAPAGVPDGPAEAPATSASAPDATTPRTHVLLVDDDSSVRSVTTRLLDRMGFEVTSFPEAERALDRLVGSGGSAFHLLVTDQTMPGLSGLELIRGAREAGCDLPVVLMSGFLNEAMIEEAGTLQALVLAKPFQRQELQRAVEQALSAVSNEAGQAPSPDRS